MSCKKGLEEHNESVAGQVDPGVHEAFEILAEFSQRKCWGEITVTFRDGKVVLINENKQTKIER